MAEKEKTCAKAVATTTHLYIMQITTTVAYLLLYISYFVGRKQSSINSHQHKKWTSGANIKKSYIECIR